MSLILLHININKRCHGGNYLNKKNNILDAWILIERLSEGNIKLNESNLKKISEEKFIDFDEVFRAELKSGRERNKLSEKQFEKSGLVFFISIFEFKQVLEIMRLKYGLNKIYEEIRESNKFGFSIYFDNNLNFVSDKLFLTASGYLKKYHKFPKDISEEEEEMRNELLNSFEEKEFNEVIEQLLQKEKVSVSDCRFRFLKNIETDDVNLHSFYIEDLEKAKVLDTNNLRRYLNVENQTRYNLDSNKNSDNFNESIFHSILSPKNYPLGRFPSEYPLTLMQQVAVNLSIIDSDSIRSVNGPPGTGKTTLLKDIFAEHITRQAIEICKLTSKKLLSTIPYQGDYKISSVPTNIKNYNILVASSNNGAVKNIVNELPKMKEIAKEFHKDILEANYFTDISNSTLTSKWTNRDGRNIKILEKEKTSHENWGVFSLEGGTSANLSKLLLHIEFIEEYLKNDYIPNPSVYKAFNQQEKIVKEEQVRIQQIKEQIESLTIEINQKTEELSKLEKIIINEEIQYNYKKNQIFEEINKERMYQKQIEIEKKSIVIDDILENIEYYQGKLNTIKEQKPSYFFIKKMFNFTSVKGYFEKINIVANQLENEMNKKLSCLKIKKKLDNNLQEILKKIHHLELKNEELVADLGIKKEKILVLKIQIDELKKKLTAYKENLDGEELDFDETYEEIQKINPWFTKVYRDNQSQLFLLGLKVRKEFLFENVSSLTSARIIWAKQKEHLGKKNESEILEAAWSWINFAIPIISTTFASLGRMFNYLPENSLGSLFIDEAGQALPQAGVGGVFRSNSVMVVGDPAQIKPVMTIDSPILNIIGREYAVSDRFISSESSTQTLVDSTSKFGFQKNESEWIGIPLWVHRRSCYPMFNISNAISYNGLMVQGISEDKVYGKSEWFDVVGRAQNKFVKEQAEFLKSEITKKISENPKVAEEIYVISPFSYVAMKLENELKSIGFTKYQNGKAINVGTVHTFQGKEAKIVYFVLGADNESSGAAKWAVNEPNMMNVAATRAKEEFYVIGDKKLYQSLRTKVANETISIIEQYNGN